MATPPPMHLCRYHLTGMLTYSTTSWAHHGNSGRAILFKYFYSECLEELATKIRKLAKKEGWPFPCPELATPDPKLLIWQRKKTDHRPHRNSSTKLLEQLVDLCNRHTTTPVVLGPRRNLSGAIKLGQFYEECSFFKEFSIPKQLWFFDELFRSYGAIASVGMMSGAMDGPAMLFEHKTVFLARHRDATPRMQKVSMVVPNLIWQRIEYEGNFQQLTDAQLQKLEQNIWG
jgi:hypothetical protein